METATHEATRGSSAQNLTRLGCVWRYSAAYKTSTGYLYPEYLPLSEHWTKWRALVIISHAQGTFAVYFADDNTTEHYATEDLLWLSLPLLAYRRGYHFNVLD